MAEAPAPVADLDFSLLSTGLGILSTSPAWPEVEAALGRLEGAGARDADRAVDIRLVREYARKLAREADTLGRALVVGAAIGGAVSGDRRLRLQRGLEVLSEAFSLRELPSTEVANVANHVMEEIKGAFGLLKLSDRYTLRRPRSPADWSRRVRAWSQGVRAHIDVVEKAVLGTMDRDALVAAAWADWGLRLRGHVDKGPGAEEGRLALPELPALICAAAGIGPGAWLRPDLASMTIWDWSRLVLGAVGINLPSTELPPSWAGAAALWALGFPAVDPIQLRDPGTKSAAAGKEAAAPPPHPYWMYTEQARNIAPGVVAVIVAGRDGPGAWCPGHPGFAAITVAPEDLLQLSRSAPRFFEEILRTSASAFLVVAVDADGAEPPELSRALRGPLHKLLRVDMYPSTPRSSPPHPFVLVPATPGELVTGLLNQAQRMAQPPS